MTIKQLVKQNKFIFICIILGLILGASAQAYSNYALTPMGNSLKKLDARAFFFWIILSLVFDLIARIMMYLSSYVYDKQSQKYLHYLRNKIISHYYSEHINKNIKPSQAQNRLTNDLKILSDQYLTSYLNVMIGISDIIFSVYVVFTFNLVLLVVIIVLAILMLFVPDLLSKRLTKATNLVSKSNHSYLDTIAKWFAGLAVLKRYRKKSILLSVLSNSSRKLENATVNESKQYNILSGLNYSINLSFQTIILSLTGFLVLNHQLDIGTLFSIGNFTSVIFSQLVMVSSQIGHIKSTKDLNTDVTKNLIPISDNNKHTSLFDFSSLSIENLKLKFSNGEQLTYPNIKINAGEKILLSGDSGVGKSTLFKLILNELKPTSGRIIFKDKKSKIINPDLSQIGYIPQDPILFPGTIEDNITMFEPKLNKRARIWSKRMQLVDDLQKFPQGIKTQINLDKNNLSGGQRQKVILARTKVYDSQIILIDEGTSAIDAKATQKILENLVHGNETIIFIAHNLTSKMREMFDREIYLTK